MGDRKKLLDELNELIKTKEAEKSETKPKPRKPKPTRAAASRANGSLSQGPITAEGKARVSANSLKHGFFANVEKLNPQDAPVYQRLHQELSYGLLPYGAVEELMVRELAMLSARLQRLEAAEYAIFCSQIEAPAPGPDTASSDTSPERKGSPRTPFEGDSVLRDQEQEIDSRYIAAAFLNTHDQLMNLHRIEAHLRRAYNRTWDRLRMLQKERKKSTAQELSKQTQAWISAKEETRNHSLDPGDFPPLPDKSGPTTFKADDEPGLHPRTPSDPPRKE